MAFDFRKVKAHQKQPTSTHEQRNNRVDELARNYNENYTEPLQIDNSYYEYYFNHNNQLINAYWNRRYYCQNQQSVNTIAEHNHLLQIPFTKACLNEMRLLTLPESCKINQLRMGYTHRTIDDWKNPKAIVKCTCSPDEIETIEHIIYHCPSYSIARNEWRQAIQNIEPKYLQNEFYSNLQFILFPHLLYSKKDLRTFDNLSKRYTLLKYLLCYLDCKFEA